MSVTPPFDRAFPLPFQKGKSRGLYLAMPTSTTAFNSLHSPSAASKNSVPSRALASGWSAIARRARFTPMTLPVPWISLDDQYFTRSSKRSQEFPYTTGEEARRSFHSMLHRDVYTPRRIDRDIHQTAEQAQTPLLPPTPHNDVTTYIKGDGYRRQTLTGGGVRTQLSLPNEKKREAAVDQSFAHHPRCHPSSSSAG